MASHLKILKKNKGNFFTFIKMFYITLFYFIHSHPHKNQIKEICQEKSYDL